MGNMENPVNIGRDYFFNGNMSEKVLRNYLSRSVVLSFLGADFEEDREKLIEDCIQTIYKNGAKYIARAGCAWIPNGKEVEEYDLFKATIKRVHELDEDVILEACIFETTYPCFNEFEIPKFVFEAFDLPYEKRGFSYEKMLFPDGKYVDHWEKDGSVPDMTRLETQMFFYFRGCLYIDLGFEALHYGQVTLIGENDTDYRCWTSVLDKVREYAKKYARRGFVLLNAHTHGIIDTNGKLMFDFHCFPCRPVADALDIPHIATEENPQRTSLINGWGNSIYNRSLGGMTYSGWKCENLPYFVEIDNYGCQPPELLNTQVDYYPWGYDESSWYANQPKWYRKEWVRYAWDWLAENDKNGYLELLGIRVARLYDETKPDCLTRGTFYYVNDPKYADNDILYDTWLYSHQLENSK